MLDDIKKQVLELCSAAQTNQSFSTELLEDGLVCNVINNDSSESKQYHGYELMLLQKAFSVKDKKIIYLFRENENGNTEFEVSTDFKLNMKELITSFNKKLKKISTKTISTVFLCDSMSDVKSFAYSLCTINYDGVWNRQELTNSELIYALLHDKMPVLKDNKLYVFDDLISLSEEYHTGIK